MIFTVEEFQIYAKKISGSSGYNEYIYPTMQSCVSESISWLEKEAIITFTSGSGFEIYDANGSNNMYLRNDNIQSIDSIEYYVPGTGFVNFIDNPQDVVIDDRNHRIFLPDGKLFNQQTKITYHYGYTSVNLPKDLKTVLKEYALTLYKNSDVEGKSRLGISADNLSVGSSEGKSYKSEYSRWEKIINKYKHYAL